MIEDATKKRPSPGEKQVGKGMPEGFCKVKRRIGSVGDGKDGEGQKQEGLVPKGGGGSGVLKGGLKNGKRSESLEKLKVRNGNRCL